MTPKDAFKLGFVSVLAEHRISPQDLIGAIEKVAAAPAVTGGGINLSSYLGTALPTAGALGIVAPLGIGHAVGGVAENLLSSDLDDPEDLRKRHLITRLRSLIDSERAKRDNRNVTEALKV